MISDDAFAQMVAEEVKNKLSSIQRAELLKKENWERWKEALIALVENLDDQLDDIDADEESDMGRYEAMGKNGRRLAREAKSSYDARRHKVSRFRFHVNKRLDEVAHMIETGQEPTSNGWNEVEMLRRAIGKHRSLLEEFDLEDTAVDRALWATLENKWLFDSIDASSL